MLLTLINDLLDLAKLETMNFGFNEEFFDFDQLISEAISTVKYEADKKSLNIKKEFQINI